jgi:hemerythrin HHE cation binding domain-containing protein
LKRAAALQGLSRDHHQALAIALSLRRARPGHEAVGAQDLFLRFWREAGQMHFRIEEEVLLPRFAAACGADNPIIARVLFDHAAIRLGALSLLAGPSPAEELHALGRRLAAHIRLEERGLFPEIEEALDPDALERLGADLERAEAHSAGLYSLGGELGDSFDAVR